jgi:hypothetical protein
MFRRGFKTWCETTSLQVRKKLHVGDADPLPPEQLAESLRVPIWTPADLQSLAPEIADRLTTVHASAWSALTIPGAKTQVIIRNPAAHPS